MHDAVEDQGGAATAEAIRNRFGPRVAEIVLGCSDTDQMPKPPWRARKEDYLARLGRATASVRLIAACDKLDNLRSLAAGYRRVGEALWEHFRGGREGTLWYHRQVVEVLRKHGPQPLIDPLDRALAELERLTQGLQ